jgi:hypothetical protein
MTGDAELTLEVGDDGDVMPLVHRTGIGNGLAVVSVGDLALDILLCPCRQAEQQ